MATLSKEKIIKWAKSQRGECLHSSKAALSSPLYKTVREGLDASAFWEGQAVAYEVLLDVIGSNEFDTKGA